MAKSKDRRRVSRSNGKSEIQKKVREHKRLLEELHRQQERRNRELGEIAQARRKLQPSWYARIIYRLLTLWSKPRASRPRVADHIDRDYTLVDEVKLCLERLSVRGAPYFEPVVRERRIDLDEVSCSIYLDDESQAAEVVEAIEQVVTEFDGIVIYKSEPIISSYKQRWVARFKRVAKSDAVQRIGDEAQRLAQLQIDKQQAEVDSKQSEAVARLIESLANAQNAVIQIGSVLVLKHEGSLIVRNLQPAELVFLRYHPTLLDNPSECMTALECAFSTPVEAPEARMEGATMLYSPSTKPIDE